MFYLYYLNLQELGQLEVLCKQLYESTDPTIRSQAEKALITFTESPDCLQKCQYVLERSTVSDHILKSSNMIDVILTLYVLTLHDTAVYYHQIALHSMCLHHLLSCRIRVISKQNVSQTLL
jgi:hypothetical protein